jgi:outer membrane protein
VKVLKKLYLLVLLLTFGYSKLSADLIRAEVGAGAWISNNSGSIDYKGDPIELDNLLGLEDTTAPYLWLNFKHFIPVIPNARVEVLKLGIDGQEKVSEAFKFAGQEYTYNSSVKSDLNLDQYDIIMYYNFLDNLMWVTLDIGAGVKYYSGYLDLIEKGTDTRERVDIDFPIPVIYGRLGAKIPFTNIGAEVDLKYFKFEPLVDAEMIDLRVKAEASILELFIVDLNIEFGYRIQRLMIDAEDNSFSDFEARAKTELEGFFGGVSLKF